MAISSESVSLNVRTPYKAVSAPGLARAAETASGRQLGGQLASTSLGGSSATAIARGADVVDFSAAAEAFAAASTSGSTPAAKSQEFRAGKVASLKQQIDSGSYDLDEVKLRKVIDGVLRDLR